MIKLSKNWFPYPGSKRGAVKILARCAKGFEPYTTLLSPFYGGGALERQLLFEGKAVIACDTDPMVRLILRLVGTRKAELVSKIRYTGPEHDDLRLDFFYWRDQFWRHGIEDELDKAYAWIRLQATSFFVPHEINSIPLNAKDKNDNFYDKIRFDIANAIEGTPTERLTFKETDCWCLLDQYPDLPAFCDPPYYGFEYIYNKDRAAGGFDHARLAQVLLARTGPWILTYNAAAEVQDLYPGCEIYGHKFAQKLHSLVKSKKGQPRRETRKGEFIIFSPGLHCPLREASDLAAPVPAALF